jgi:hypothetical protein
MHNIETCAPTFAFMAVSSIGIQIIMPKTGTSPKEMPPQPTNERGAATPPVVRQAPPPPGMGKLVDKTA